MFIKFKGSAIHNLVITGVSPETKIEGLLLDKKIMEASDLHNGQEIIITRIGAGSWSNRIKTVVHESKVTGEAAVCGSLIKFLNPGELTCVIGEVYLDEERFGLFNAASFPIFDLGFDPKSNTSNTDWNLDFQYANKVTKNVSVNSINFIMGLNSRESLYRIYAQSAVIGLKINKTHPDCLQGSAELPKSVMVAADLKRYKSVTVYNSTVGGAADTYAVPMPEGVVMTTGAMASFAKIGETVNVISYVISNTPVNCKTIITNGECVI